MNVRQLKNFQKHIELDILSGCWIWKKYKNKKGYGVMGKGHKIYLSHRVSYEYFKGEIPNGLELDHLCRNRDCCNPYHLEPVTHIINLKRGIKPYRPKGKDHFESKKTHCKNGHEFNETNTYFYKNGHRGCRQCGRDRWKLRTQHIKKSKNKRKK